MNPQNDSYALVQNEIGQLEQLINCYHGPDPLDLWFRYICYLETNTKSMQGIEDKFRKSVEQCLSLYDKYENYKQDLRMVKLWIKYIDFQPNKPNLYKILYQQGIGTKCAAFYIAWAHYYNYYNSDNSLKQAESIYNLGLQLKAEPLHELETAQKNFRYSVAQRMLYNDESSKKRTISSLAEQRQQITSLELSPNSKSQQQQQPASKRMRTDSSSSNISEQFVNQVGYSEQNIVNSANDYAEYNNGGGSYDQNQVQGGPSNDITINGNGTQYTPNPSQNIQNACQSEQPKSSHQHQQPQQYIQQNYHYQANEANFAMNSSLNYAYDENTVYTANTVEKQQPPVNFTFECGFQMPLNFISYSSNSLDPWDGLLFLEEPYDPNRRCFYPKNTVYPGDGSEYSLEELMANKWRIKVEEKRKREELERIRQEQEKIRLELERKRQEEERLRQEQERIRREQEAIRLKIEQQRAEADRLRKQQEEEQRNRYQMYQQQQQWNNYHSPVNFGSPAAYHQQYHQQSFENSPQYSYSHDHQYQTHFQHYQNSPSYYQQQPIPPNSTIPQQSVIVNRNQYENHQYYNNYAPQQQQHVYDNTYRPPIQQQSTQFHGYPVQQPQNNFPQQIQVQKPPNFEEPDYQDVEYLIDHQAEIDPRMLQQPIIENENGTSECENNESEEESDEGQIPTIVNSYMLDDLEEQIEASTISFSSNGKSRDKKITIKFRKEKTIIANESSSSSSQQQPQQQRSKVPLEADISASSSSQKSNKKKSKKKNGDLLTSFDGENTQFMPSATNSNSSTHTTDQSFGKITFNGCITPVRKQAASKTSTPVGTYKFLKKKGSFLSSQNDESFLGDQNSFFQAENDDEYKSRRLEKAVATIDEHFNKRDIDPFNSELCRAFLTKLNFPSRENEEGYKVTSTNLPKFAKNQIVPICGVNYQLEKEVGRGSYGYVYRGINLYDGTVVALKYQRASNLSTWELYICTEVKKRIKNADILPGFMTVSAAVIAPNASVLISEFSQYGSLLDINNRIRTATTKVMHESLAMHFASQILNIVAHLHDCKIVHADIKPDNFLLMTLPSVDDHVPSLRLIDFGCAIDMDLFKEGQEFRKIIETAGFTCVEMQEGRTWSYQTDLFCIAGTIHVMLFGEYMQVKKNFGVWEIKQKFPRYLNKTLWTEVFSKLLNIKDCNNLPNLRQMKLKVDREINDNELVKHIRTVNNLIRKR